MTTIEVSRIGFEEMKVIEGCPAIVVYGNPSDYPEKLVARLWDLHNGEARPTEIAVITETLQDLRDRIQGNGLYLIPRMLDDDPCIMEVWI